MSCGCPTLTKLSPFTGSIGRPYAEARLVGVPSGWQCDIRATKTYPAVLGRVIAITGCCPTLPYYYYYKLFINKLPVKREFGENLLRLLVEGWNVLVSLLGCLLLELLKGPFEVWKVVVAVLYYYRRACAVDCSTSSIWSRCARV